MTIKIKTDDGGNILLAGTSDKISGEVYTGEVPTDFFATFSLGKYTFVDSEIVENLEFVMPTEVRDTRPNGI